jgi:hypothetical protein
MKNIIFHYLYRDAANYKNLNSIIFSNDINMELTDLDGLIKSKLIGGCYFYADAWEIPDMHFGTWDEEFDHGLHEFECIEYTNAPSNQSISIKEFKELIEKTNWE